MRLSDLREVREHSGSTNDFRNATISITQGLITKDEYLADEYHYNGERYYSSNEYEQIHDGSILSNSDVFWCESNEEFYDAYDAVRLHEGRIDRMVSRQSVEGDSDFICFDGEYYDDQAQERNEIEYIRDIQEYGYANDNYYHDGEGYYSYPEEDDNEEYTRSYHNGSYKELSFGGTSKYKIGYEIEKEDAEVLESIDIDEFENSTDNVWRKERDGSLSDDCGYELISPTFEFNITKIFEHIESNPILVEHINANTSSCCGGHINLSEKKLSGQELFDKIKGYTPLFYALYYGRVNKTFCKGKCNDDLKSENEKYQAIKIHHDRVEFRIISAVPSVETLKWRTKLIRTILRYPTADIRTAFFHVETKFKKLLSEQYGTDERMTVLKNRFIKFSLDFENIDLKENNN